MKWNHWLVVGLGAWLLISPWLLGFSRLDLVVWNNIVVGILLLIFSFWNFSQFNNK
ncbi:hypothetical protein COY65_01915 [Candidatus Jorgensenbacteria bacterium CG_4_10_14_0_8_um_filter_39_13]|uniref:SPW repeat-containing integral membrane domain-containing protein n=2 Tax=Candidatus Joergenseniibacteriota TaxID=1752739 RepID=A0A2M7RGQ0_9BACT|nr:SPW repeat protein [Candidatus Wolfebacteria bacterium]PIR07468.1 MAG: hypothetical protein COV54_00940 [Candidatus Jorgensenbacteria bacterium CG11_big_fil_rev_8_21_14_0_20_38_23]PIV13084.1 MAG: hypothetical protein COS46_02110 [Candidatus Jorgensenbacteria bacterium CG03_land_8_20_14_0_80_38_39]PIW97910.1 MAG: hypothetical protein COZ81_00025 [Candidatus Jorgensenbacteria bacterium CG_4_8_14_3_um_filter_38_10]PIY95930.1 MAG: hypothetical protein COY65_01915 [Candidatus Jorgensenbacteria ba